MEQDTKVLTAGCILWLIFIPSVYWIGYVVFSIHWLLMIPIALATGYGAGAGSMHLLDIWLTDRHRKQRQKRGTGEAEKFFDFVVAVFGDWYDHNGNQEISHESASGRRFVKALERSQTNRVVEMIQTSRRRSDEASDWDIQHDRDVDEALRNVILSERFRRNRFIEIIELRLAAEDRITPSLLDSIVQECKAKAQSLHSYQRTSYVVDGILNFKW